MHSFHLMPSSLLRAKVTKLGLQPNISGAPGGCPQAESQGPEVGQVIRRITCPGPVKTLGARQVGGHTAANKKSRTLSGSVGLK